MHANSSNCDSNDYSGWRSRRPTADADADSLAFPDSVWRNPYAHGHSHAHSNPNAVISAYSLAQPDTLAQPDANSYAEPLALGFPDRKPAAVSYAHSVGPSHAGPPGQCHTVAQSGSACNFAFSHPDSGRRTAGVRRR